MNIELVKQEIKTLSTLIDAWQEGKEVSAIERQVALNKLARLYELIGISNNQADDSYVAPIAALADIDDNKQESNETEQEVEVEIIFADEEVAETAEESEAEIDSTPEEKAEGEPMVAEEPVTEEEPAIEPLAAEIEPIADVEPVQEAKKESKEEKPRSTEYQAPMMESLFGADEIQRRPRSKHQRMMAIYEEAQPKQERQEKVVDISKIFDMDEDNLLEMNVAEPTIHEAETSNDPIITSEKASLADTIATRPILADSIAAPAALAEEMTNSKIDSLHQAIGINDKFLMIRDLFDGDNRAYDEAIAALDKQTSLEDCMIYIIENYQWNPDVEGSKFIMQLLERKFS